MKKQVPDKWFYFPIIILGINFLIRIIDQAKIMWVFPLDYTNDWSSYIAQLFFLAKCGFHNFCPYWYSGFKTFLITSPGWYFFALPFYLITNNVQAGAYLSVIAMFTISYIFIYILCKKNGLSRIKSIAFFFLFFGSAFAIGDFIRLGRVVSLFPFMLLIPFVTLLLYYKIKKLDKYFLLFIPLYSLILMSHPQETVIFSFLIFGLFFTKKRIKDKLYIVACFFGSILLSSFWLIPFLFASTKATITTSTYSLGTVLWGFTYEPLTSLASIIIPFVLFLLFYLYWRTNKLKKETLFYSPLLFLNLIFILRIYPFIPLLRNIHPDPFLTLFLFFIIFFFFKLDFSQFSLNRKKMIFVLFNLAVLLNVTISIIHTPWFINHSQSEKETLSLFKYMDGKYLIYGESPTAYNHAYYSYTPIFFNLSTASGWYPHMISVEYKNLLKDSHKFLEKKDCQNFLYSIKMLNVTNMMAYNELCKTLNECGFNKKASINNICVYSYNKK